MSLREFNERLVRRLSIETGILERLYDLDRGTTETLVAQGFAENLVSRGDTDIEPSSLIDILKDQEAAIQHAMSFVSGKRILTKAFLHELHAMLLRHQATTEVVDTLGNRSQRPLIKGKYKEHPNNPRRPDGGLHEYCPPIHVESEMDNLLKWHNDYRNEDPIIVAAWLHHRFTQIHPYQDGNGRLARILTTMVLAHHDLLPVVIEREDRARYIEALEKADADDLSVFASLLAGLEKDAILRALSIESEEPASLTAAVISNIENKVERHREQQSTELRKVNEIAKILQGKVSKDLKLHITRLKDALSTIGDPRFWIDDIGPSHEHSRWYKSDVIKSAKAVKKFANFSEDHYFTKAAFEVSKERLVFVVSFHHIGRELTGIMEATAFFRLETKDDDAPPSEFHICSQPPLGPFVFSNETQYKDVEKAFSRWLDEVFAVAVKSYGERL